MKTKLTIIIISIVAASLLLTAYQPSNAVTYYGHDGSVDKYLEKVQVKKLKKGDFWSYIVRACATDYTLGVAQIILKSDSEQVNLGVNKNIPKGKCSAFGAVMKAKDGSTLGAELIEKHEAIDRMQSILNNMPKSSNKINSAMSELIQIITTTGILPK